MRKKFLTFAAFLAAFGFATQSCTNDDVENGALANAQNQNYIKYSTLMDGMNATRAASTTADVMNVANEEMDVIGYYANDVATAAQQGIQYVGVSNAPITLKYGAAWDYKNPADMSFWPGGDIYFQAVYPSTFTGVTANALAVDAKTPRLNRNVTIQSDAANQIDLVFGDAVASEGTVGLVFKHGLSKIDFNAQMLTSTMSARIKDVKIHNVYAQANVGFLGAVSGQKRDLSVSGYTALAAANSFDAGITEKAITAYNSTSNPTTNLMADGGSLILMPQTAALMTADSKTLIPAWTTTNGTAVPLTTADNAASLATYFELDVYLKTQDGTELLGSYNSGTDTYTYAKVYIPFQADWAQGTSYTYTFQIGAGTGGYKADGTPIFAPISYTVTSVADWTNGGNNIIPEPEYIDLSMVDNAGAPRASRTTANCYMVHDAGYYKLPLVYGNAIKNGSTNASAYHTETGNANQLTTFVNHADMPISDPWIKNNKQSDGTTPITVDGATLVWQDAQGLISSVSVDGDYLKFEIPDNASTKSGNAVLAAKSGEQIVWSWHIWVTTETFSSLTTIPASTTDGGEKSHTYRITPVNIGWISTGTNTGYHPYFQWGRKDPMIPSTGSGNYNHNTYDIDGNTITSSANNTCYDRKSGTTYTIGNTIQNPISHYHNSSTFGPYNETKNNYWDMECTALDNASDASTARYAATVKTIYDPSPAGFCVPTSGCLRFICDNYSSYLTWSDNPAGRTWTYNSASVFFPASGFRGNNTGTLSDVGSFGCYWGATPYDPFNGRQFGCGRSNVYLTNVTRSVDCPVRAVAEE